MNKYKNNEIKHCTLCAKEYNLNENSPKCLMPCGHRYCNSCLLKKKYYNCPKCKEKINQWIPDYEVLDTLNQSKNFSVALPSFQNDIKNDTSSDKTKQENILELINLVLSDDMDQKLMGTQRIRKLLSIELNPPIQEVIEANLVPKLIQFLQSNNQTLQFEAAWAVTNIASGNTNQTEFVIKSGAVPIFIDLIGSENEDVKEQAIWALGNIAGDSPANRDLVIDHGILPLLLDILSKPQRISMTRNALWCLCNLCRGKNPHMEFSQVKLALSMLPILAKLLCSDDIELLADACWTLSYLSDGPNENIQHIIESNVCSRLVELLRHSTTTVVVPCLRAVGNIVTGDDVQTQVILNCNVLPILFDLLSSPKESIRKETCWIISNITAGNDSQIQAVIDANIFPKLIQISMEGEFQSRKEAAWALSNATSNGTEEQINYLVQLNVIPALCSLLDISESKVVQVALEGLENILKSANRDADLIDLFVNQIEECGGLHKLELLQNHENSHIYEKASLIIGNFFGENEDF